jgi:hypothetical protein
MSRYIYYYVHTAIIKNINASEHIDHYIYYKYVVWHIRTFSIAQTVILFASFGSGNKKKDLYLKQH